MTTGLTFLLSPKCILCFVCLIALQTCYPQWKSVEQQRLVDEKQKFQEHLEFEVLNLRRKIVFTGLKQLGVKYQYGGELPRTGFDCSGLIQYSYAMHGVPVARTTEGQLSMLELLPMEELQPADILLFKTGDKTYHTGIYLGSKHMLHAPATGKKVTISNFTNSYWQPRLYKAGRLKSLHDVAKKIAVGY